MSVNQLSVVNNEIFLNSMADPRWWMLFIFVFLPWLVWWKFVDKSRLFEILAYGLLWAAMSTWLDLLGTMTNAWHYPFNIFDKLPTLLPADGAVIPVVFMLLYQYSPTWRSFIIGSAAVSLLFSFIFEPLFELLNILAFDFQKWNHIKSTFSFFILANITKGVMVYLKRISKKF